MQEQELRNLLDELIALGADQVEMEQWYAFWPAMEEQERNELVANLQRELEIRKPKV
jgi:hypothetical protein